MQSNASADFGRIKKMNWIKVILYIIFLFLTVMEVLDCRKMTRDPYERLGGYIGIAIKHTGIVILIALC